MDTKNVGKPIIMLVEDNPGDARLVQEALRETKVLNNLHIARDGVEASYFCEKKASTQKCQPPT